MPVAISAGAIVTVPNNGRDRGSRDEVGAWSMLRSRVCDGEVWEQGGTAERGFDYSYAQGVC